MSTNAKAAKTLQNAKTKKADPPVAPELDLDFNFLDYDPTAIDPFLAQHGMEKDPSLVYRWITSDPRRIDRRVNIGWRPTSIRRGDTVLATMPKERHERMKAQIEERKALKKEASFARYEHDTRKITKDGRISVTD